MELAERKIPQGISFPFGLLAQIKSEAERAGITVSEYVAESVELRLRSEETTEEGEVEREEA